MSAAGAAVATGGGRTRRWVLPTVLGTLVLLLVFVSFRTTPQVDRQPYELESTGPMGLRALRESLRRMGYVVRDLRGERFTLPAEGDLLLSYPGREPWVRDEEAEALRRWVASGRTAMVVATQNQLARPFAAWGADGYGGMYALNDSVDQSQPGLPSAPAALARGDGSMAFDFSRRIVQLTVIDDSEWRATLGVEQVGMGWLWYVADNHALTNALLRDPDQTAILAAVLRAVPDGGIIYFDAYHLYGPAAGAADEGARFATLQEWLYFAPLGQATLLALVVAIVGWVLAGRRLGPPLKMARELKRREGAEYVRAIAGLKRRAHARDDILQRQAQRLKLALGKPMRIPANLPDAQFIDALRYSGDMEAQRVAEAEALLKRLRAAASEDELVKTAAAIDALLAK